MKQGEKSLFRTEKYCVGFDASAAPADVNAGKIFDIFKRAARREGFDIALDSITNSAGMFSFHPVTDQPQTRVQDALSAVAAHFNLHLTLGPDQDFSGQRYSARPDTALEALRREQILSSGPRA